MDGKDIKRILGDSIKDLRIAKGFTQEQLAELINVQTNSINRIETGVNFIKCDTLAELSNIFEVYPALLFSARPTMKLNSNEEMIKLISKILQTFTPEKLQEVYNILRVMNTK